MLICKIKEESKNMKRREFISKSVGAGVVAGVATTPLLANSENLGTNNAPQAADRTAASSTKGMKVGLYSITYLGCWYKDRPLTWQEVLQRAKDFGYDSVEFDAKRPHANPMDWTPDIRKAVKDRAGELGIELCALASNNNFASPVPEQREAEILMVREQIKLAADLGCPVVRVFGAWNGITFRDGWATYDEAGKNGSDSWPGVPRNVRMQYIQDALAELAKIAGDYGVVLGLQNHGPLIRNWRDVLELITYVDSPNLKAIIDVPHNEDRTDNVIKAIRTVGDKDIHFHFNGEFERLSDGSIGMKYNVFGEPIQNYQTLVNELARIGFKGHLCWEFCHNVIDSKGKPGTLKEVDGQTVLALEYMRKAIANAKKIYG